MPAPLPTAVPSFRSRIGRDARSGYHAVPRRYRLHLTLSCPRCLQIAITNSLLGLDDTLPVTLLPAVPDAPGGGHQALRPLYETSSHQHPGPAVAPVLSDEWTGRIVSTHAPDILRDLALRFGAGGPELHPCGTEEELAEVARLCEQGITASAQRAGQPGADPSALATLLSGLDALERRLTSQPYVLGPEPTLADVQVWVTLLRLDTVHRWHLDAGAVHSITGHPRLWAYARRLAALPAFGSHLDVDGIDRRHHAHCRGHEAAGAAVRIVDWTACASQQAPEPVR
ncbi:MULTISPECIES: glutathione S-transferase C-terminal domain-containing protein [unclassified Streptomyces]|uniref:glutathione S-transferase C-terminal domain-containing protein n=1 Tax=unclassified Streptomyces TaxID=2593676 RepID=UPI002DDC7436|nr:MULTISPECIES: glutathione S-transferase C-terminal domain-containing protein [unclassified Streptomyces]WSA94652.1 glutathione S-transferase C-terminal domain-containing protein [Streptomyces sp. NBC_01795]WSS12728.1 glutathione S-transferase C-terminal domain-containing protein [Streptomyces sp. NBC_01186]WSS41511.1 glutathione S-transferase C-terminal domain-containing protein [Streptomyces sp. NBC_01187]